MPPVPTVRYLDVYREASADRFMLVRTEPEAGMWVACSTDSFQEVVRVARHHRRDTAGVGPWRRICPALQGRWEWRSQFGSMVILDNEVKR